MSAYLFFFHTEPVARAGRVLLHDMCPEVEELLEGQQVLVCLLAPLSETDQHEVLLQVPLLLCPGVEARVLDRDRRLEREGLCALHLFRGEHATAITLGPQGERRVPAAAFVTGIFETALAADELLRAVEVPVLPPEARWGHWKFCRKVGEFSKATACVLALPGQVPRAVLAALDAPPLVIEDARALMADPVAEAARILAGFPGLTAWRRAIAGTALRHAVELTGAA